MVHHLTNVAWRWIDGGFLGAAAHRHEAELRPADLTLAEAVARDREREALTEAAVRSRPLTTPCTTGEGLDLRWVLHLLDETARHAGHADATREPLDGTTGG